MAVVGYGRVSHPSAGKQPDDVGIAGGKETEAAPDLAVTVDGHPIPAREALDVESAARGDYTESLTAVRVTVLGMTALTGTWSPWAWELLPAHIAIASVAVPAGRHDVVVHVRGTATRRGVDVAARQTRVVATVVPW